MTKNLPAAVLTSLNAEVTAHAMCIEIKRKDGRVYRMTDHNINISYGGETYYAAYPFEVGTIDSGANLSVDNTSLTLFCDGTYFKLADFQKKLFNNAKITIFWLDTATPSNGRIIGRVGWFGSISYDQNSKVEIEVVGLMKTLDFEVIRTYQPACDATFGDSRCKVSLDLSQAYFLGNTYCIGDWVHIYDETVMTNVALSNESFEADGINLPGVAVTGWTPIGTHYFGVSANPGGTLTPPAGTYALYGGADGGDNDNGYVSTLYQDQDISGWGTTDIDDGKLVYALFYSLASFGNTASGGRVTIDMLDANGDVIYSRPQDYIYSDTINAWKRHAIVEHILPTTRTIRVYVSVVKGNDTDARIAIDWLKQFYYDHTTTSPHNDIVFKLGGVNSGDNEVSVLNARFEDDGTIAEQADPPISGWDVEAGKWGSVTAETTTPFGMPIITPQSRFFYHGDDSSGIQHSTRLSQSRDLITDWGLVAEGIDAGDYFVRGSFTYGYPSGNPYVWLKYVFRDAVGSDISAHGFYTGVGLQGGAGVWHRSTGDLTVPPGTRSLYMEVTPHSPVGSSAGTILIYNWTMEVVGTSTFRQQQTVCKVATLTPTDFTYTAGQMTYDDELVWRAHSIKTEYDVVDTVTNRKTFTGTGIAASDVTYRTGTVLWLSGANAGYRSTVRIYDNGTKGIKLYQPAPYTIVSGDRFWISEGCLKRFAADCKTRFDNAINFRGFPYVPGRFVKDDQA